MLSYHYPSHPFVGIGVTVWQNDKVLLVRRKNPPAPGQWGLPGGKQQLGETIMEAAVREVFEETGIAIAPIGIITALDGITRDEAGKVEYHYTIIEVAGEYQSGEAKADDDACDVCWATLAEVETLCSWKEVARVVRLSLLQRVL
jgi:ADP-ribose pyrophosphatase YjhB (NUDIX family)